MPYGRSAMRTSHTRKPADPSGGSKLWKLSVGDKEVAVLGGGQSLS